MRSLNALRKRRGSVIESLEDRRLLSAGFPVSNFGKFGSVLLPQLSHVQQAAPAPDGKIVVLGSLGSSRELLRLTATGAVDSGFGMSGMIDLPAPAPQSTGLLDISTIAIEADNKIILAGDDVQQHFALLRLNSDGSVDSAFGTGGMASLPFDSSQATDLLITPDQKIVASGSGATNSSGSAGFVIARFNPNGTLDPSFNNAGVLLAPLDLLNPSQGIISTDGQGRLLAAGVIVDAADHRDAAAIARLNPDGSLDTSFNSTGTSLFDLPTGLVAKRLLAINARPDGSTVLLDSSNSNSETLRVAPSGAFDAGYGPDASGVVAADGDSISVDSAGFMLATGGFSGVVRIRPLGTIDVAFGENRGFADASPSNSDPTTRTVITASAAMPDGTLIAVGTFGDVGLVTRLDDSHAPNPLPVANPQGPYTVIEGQKTPLFGVQPQDNSIVEYQWDFNYDGTTFMPDASGQTTTFDATNLSGTQTRTIALRVLDGYGATSIATTTVTIVHVPPQVRISASGTVVQGEPYTLSLSAVGEPDPRSIQSWAINWGDGTIDTLPGNPPTAAHIYQDAPTTDTITAAVNEAGASYAANDISLDPAFGSGGVALQTAGSVADVASLPDGRVLVLGTFAPPNKQFTTAIERFNADGTLDATFADAGVAPIIAPAGSAPFFPPSLLRVQPDGKLVAVMGNAIVRLNADGSLDASFGVGGVVAFKSISKNLQIVRDLKFTSNGKIVILGTIRPNALNGSISELNPDGSVDRSFVITTGVNATPLAADPGLGLFVFNDGSLLIPDYSSANQTPTIVAVKLHADGSFDQGFGLGGRAGLIGTLGENFFGSDVLAVLPDGGFLVGGPGGNESRPLQLARFRADGTLDTSFGANGLLQLVTFASVRSILPQPDGSALVVFYDPSDRQLGIARITANGKLDTSIGENGIAMLSLDPETPLVSLRTTPVSATLDVQGRLIVLGTATPPTGNQAAQPFLARLLVQPLTVSVLPGKRPPLVSIVGVPSTTVEGAAYQFTSSASITSAADPSKTSYAWSVTKDGAPIDLGVPSNGASFVFDPPDNGSYVVTLSVTDSLGDTASAAQSVTVLDAAPTASFSVDGPITAGHTSIARFTNAFDARADLAAGFTYSYDFNNDGKFEIKNSSSPTAIIPAKYLAAGVHKIHGRITDKDGGFTDYVVSVNVLPVVPALGSISGVVFLDNNKNGKQDKNEKGLAGVALFIDANHNGRLDKGEIRVKTDGGGHFTFSGLAGGKYRIREVVPKGRKIELPKAEFVDVQVSTSLIANLVFANL